MEKSDDDIEDEYGVESETADDGQNENDDSEAEITALKKEGISEVFARTLISILRVKDVIKIDEMAE
jgi:hypothetical protein